MNVRETTFQGAYIIEPLVFNDNRGFFMESYNIFLKSIQQEVMKQKDVIIHNYLKNTELYCKYYFPLISLNFFTETFPLAKPDIFWFSQKIFIIGGQT